MIFPRLRPKTPISNLKSGKIVTIRGVLHASKIINIPPSGTPCVFYSLIVERYGKGPFGRGRPLWFAEKNEKLSSVLSVSDGSNTLSLEFEENRIRVRTMHREQGQAGKNRKRRYFAEFLCEGDEVIVRGRVGENDKDGLPVLTVPRKGPLEIVVAKSALQPKPD